MGGIFVKEIFCGCIVIVFVFSIIFKKFVKVGDVVCCYGECIKIGCILMLINFEVWVKLVKEEGVGECF